MAVIGYPQRMTTVLTTLLERDQRFLVRRLGTRISASHVLAPASKGQRYHPSLLLLSTQVCRSAVFWYSLLVALCLKEVERESYKTTTLWDNNKKIALCVYFLKISKQPVQGPLICLGVGPVSKVT